MSATYIGHAAPLNQRAKLTIAAHGTYIPTWIAARIFLGTYLITVTGSFFSVAIFHLASSIALCITFYLVAPSCKQHGLLKKFRAGLMLCVVFFLYLAVTKENIGSQLIVAGLLFGTANGFYWFPYHLYKMTMSVPTSRLTYFAYENNLAQALHLVLPAFFGWLIWTRQSYIGLFILLAVFASIGCIISSKLESRGKRFEKEYSLRRLIELTKEHPELLRMYLANTFMGMTIWGTLSVFVPILMYLATGSELDLGIYASLLPIIVIVINLLVKRIPKNNYGKVALLSASILMLGTFLIIWESSEINIMIFWVLVVLCSAPLGLLQALFSHNVIEKTEELSQYIPEHFVFLEVGLTVGRLIGYSLLFFLAELSITSVALQSVLFVLTVPTLLAAWVLMKTDIDS